MGDDTSECAGLASRFLETYIEPAANGSLWRGFRRAADTTMVEIDAEMLSVRWPPRRIRSAFTTKAYRLTMQELSRKMTIA